jgi:hypothetical protein
MEVLREFKLSGYGYIEKEIKGGSNSARVFLPKAWEGKKCAVILLEPLTNSEEQ